MFSCPDRFITVTANSNISLGTRTAKPRYRELELLSSSFVNYTQLYLYQNLFQIFDPFTTQDTLNQYIVN